MRGRSVLEKPSTVSGLRQGPLTATSKSQLFAAWKSLDRRDRARSDRGTSSALFPARGKQIVMGSAEMSSRAHFWLRVAGLVVIAAAAWLPRGFTTGSTASMQSGEAQAIHASVSGR
jgi:hypothetical protein